MGVYPVKCVNLLNGVNTYNQIGGFYNGKKTNRSTETGINQTAHGNLQPKRFRGHTGDA